MEETIITNGTMSQIEPAYNGGEILPVNQADDNRPTTAEMVGSIAVVAIGGYLVGKLGEFAWNELIVPGYVKAVEKINDVKKTKDERVARRKNKDVIEGESLKDVPEDNPDENQDDEQSLPKKGMKSVNRLHKEKRKR